MRFTGPDNVMTPAQNGTPTVELTPGDYTVSADPIGPYEAEISAPSLNVTSTTDQTVTVTYAIPKGSVRVIVSGLPTPPPASGLVRLTGPEPQNIPAESGSTDLSLRQGTYGVSADPVGDYEPSLSTSSVSVGKGSSSTITVSYAIPAAPLSVRVEGLPSGNSAPITVSGPEFVTLNVPSGSAATANLAPGSYTVSAPNLTIGGTKYQPDPASGAVSLGKGGASHVVTYVGVVVPPSTTTPPPPSTTTPPPPSTTTPPPPSTATPPPPSTTTPPLPSTEQPKPTNVTLNFAGVDSKVAGKYIVTNTQTGQAWVVEAQEYSGREAGSVTIYIEGGKSYQAPYAALPPKQVVGALVVPPGKYRVSFAHQGDGYRMDVFGFTMHTTSGKATLPSPDPGFDYDFAGTGRFAPPDELDLQAGSYNVMPGYNPPTMYGYGVAKYIQCAAWEVLSEIGCVNSQGEGP